MLVVLPPQVRVSFDGLADERRKLTALQVRARTHARAHTHARARPQLLSAVANCALPPSSQESILAASPAGATSSQVVLKVTALRSALSTAQHAATT